MQKCAFLAVQPSSALLPPNIHRFVVERMQGENLVCIEDSVKRPIAQIIGPPAQMVAVAFVEQDCVLVDDALERIEAALQNESER